MFANDLSLQKIVLPLAATITGMHRLGLKIFFTFCQSQIPKRQSPITLGLNDLLSPLANHQSPLTSHY